MNEDAYLQTVKKTLGKNKIMVALGGAGWKIKSPNLSNVKRFIGFKDFLTKITQKHV